MGFDVSFMVFDGSNMDIDQGEIPHTYAGKIKKAPFGADFQMVRETGVEPVPFRFFMLFFRLLVSFLVSLVYTIIDRALRRLRFLWHISCPRRTSGGTSPLVIGFYPEKRPAPESPVFFVF
jgi:hypothetical protein